MKNPKINRKTRKDTSVETEVLGFCPYCRILSPTLTSEKRMLGTVYAISCICRESNGMRITSRNREKAIRKWRDIHVD